MCAYYLASIVQCRNDSFYQIQSDRLLGTMEVFTGPWPSSAREACLDVNNFCQRPMKIVGDNVIYPQTQM